VTLLKLSLLLFALGSAHVLGATDAEHEPRLATAMGLGALVAGVAAVML